MGLLIPTFHVRIKTPVSEKLARVRGPSSRGYWCARGFTVQPVQVITSTGCCLIQQNSVKHFCSLIKPLTMPRVQELQEVGGNIGGTLANKSTQREALTHTLCSLTTANFITSLLLRPIRSENAKWLNGIFREKKEEKCACFLCCKLVCAALRFDPSDSHFLTVLGSTRCQLNVSPADVRTRPELFSR